ncbi:hypothetical protein MMC25_005236 [Agyrium rufum]|nr:hypothetical protein [Agyrium rufum]
MRSFIQILSTPTADTPGTSIMLHFDDQRYLLGNIAEGSQRTALALDWKLVKTSNIFLTGKTEWKNIGGLLGMILTVAESLRAADEAAKENAKVAEEKKRKRAEAEAERLAAKAKKVKGNTNGAKGGAKPMGRHEQEQAESLRRKTQSKMPPDAQKAVEKTRLKIHGGPNLTHTLATARRFIFRKGMPVDVTEFNESILSTEEPTWSDDHIRVWAMPIKPQTSHTSRPSSPRKRSFDEYKDNATTQPSSDMSPSDADGLRRQIVGNMFDSNWSLDTLVEKKLADVRLPAKIFVRDPDSKQLKRYHGPLPGDANVEIPDLDVLVRKPWPASSFETLPPAIPSPIAMSYIVRCHDQRGKFRKDKALALGVQQGADFSLLSSGSEVTSKDGKTVKPEDVMDASTPGHGFAVVELPSAEYVESLASRPEWENQTAVTGLQAILWILGPGVVENKLLQEFMAKMKDLKHIVSSSEVCQNSIALDSAASAAIRLNQIDAERYPVPVHANTPAKPFERDAYRVDKGKISLIAARRGLSLDLHPNVRINEENITPLLDTAEVVESTPEDVLSLAREIRNDIASEQTQKELAKQDLPSPEAEIICLGTGSAQPSKYRNVSGTLLRVPGSGSYLLDAGENTLGQLKRIYNADELLEVLRDLKMIWISHLHADHHLGITSVIKAWYQAVHGDSPLDGTSTQDLEKGSLDTVVNALQVEKRLFVVSHTHMMKWLQEYSGVEDFGYSKLVPLSVRPAQLGDPLSTRLFLNNEHDLSLNLSSPAASAAMRTATGLTDLAACLVPHCYGAQAVSLTFPTGFKFSFSGDCRPSRAFAEIGQGTTVLLHEATFDDEMQGDAVAKNHSTTKEAIGVGLAMGARRILLTHFSQRYQNIPVMGDLKALDVRLEEEDEGQAEGQGDEVADVVVDAERDGAADEKNVKTATQDGTEAGPSRPQQNGEVASNIAFADEAPRWKRSRSSLRSAPSQTPILPTIPLRSSQDVKIGVAFDYMRVKVKDIMLLERFTPALTKLYSLQETEKDERKKRNKERMVQEEKERLKAREDRVLLEREMARRKREEVKGGNGSRRSGGDREKRDGGRERKGSGERERVQPVREGN